MATIRDMWFPANKIIHSARQMLNEELKPLNLSSAEGNILLHMLMDETVLYQEQLAQQLDIDKAAVSRAVESLVKKGYLCREKNPGDKRFYRLILTAAARDAAQRLREAYDAIYERATTGVTPEQFEMLAALLRLIADNFSQS